MNKNTIYIAVFGVLCVLTGVLVGAGIVKKKGLPRFGFPQQRFEERAEHFMRYGQRGQEARRGGAGLLEIMANKLGLTEEQKTKIKDILEKTRQEINTVGKDVRSAIAGIREKSDKQIMEILTPEQQEKFKALQKEFKKRGGFKGPRGGHRAMRGYEPCPSEELPPPQQ